MATVNACTETAAIKAVLSIGLTIGILLFEESLCQLMIERPTDTVVFWSFGAITLLQVTTGWLSVMAVVFTRELCELLFTSKLATKKPPSNTGPPMPRNVMYRITLISIIFLVASLKLEEMFAETLIFGNPSPTGANWPFRLIAIMQIVAQFSTFLAIFSIIGLLEGQGTDIEELAAENSSNKQRHLALTKYDAIAMFCFFGIIAIGCLGLEQMFAGDLILGKLTPTGIKWMFRLVMGLQLFAGIAASGAVAPIFMLCQGCSDKVKLAARKSALAARTSNAEQV